MGRAESRPRERQSRRLSSRPRRAAGASSLPFLSRLSRAASRLALALPLLAGAAVFASAASADVLVGNVGHDNSRSVFADGTFAQSFTTASKASLASIELEVRTTESDFDIDDLTVTIAAASGGNPGSTLATLGKPGSISDASRPVFTAPSDTDLAANSTYFVVIAYAGGDNEWTLHYTTRQTEDSGGKTGWSIGNSRHTRSQFGTWSSRSNPYQIRVNGTVTPNAAPTAAGNTITVDQDDTYTFSVSDFPFEDADGDTLQSVSINNRPVKGTMQLDGAPVPIGQAIPVADIEDGKLTYAPATGESGTTYSNFSFRVSDGTDQSGTVVMIIDVTPTPPPVVQFESSAASLDESSRRGNIIVQITGTRQGNESVVYTVSSSGSNPATPCPTGSTVSSCANAGYDFYDTLDGETVTDYSRTKTFAVHETPAVLTVISLVPDTAVEGDETLTITLSNPTNATLGTNSVLTVTIVDDDEPPPTNLRTTTVRALDAVLAWDAVAGADSYQYRVQNPEGVWSAWTDQTETGSGASTRVRGLAPASAYGFQVRAVNSTGTGAASATLAVTTGSLSWTVEVDETDYTEGDNIAVTVRAVTSYGGNCPSGFPLSLALTVSDPDVVLPDAATRTLNFAACQSSKTETFATVDDNTEEANAAVTFTLALSPTDSTPHLSATLSATPPSAQVAVADNDGPAPNANNLPTGVPTITGTPQVGQTLTANTSGIADADGLGTFAYQWIRGSEANIAGATGSTYQPVAADIGHTLKVRVSWTDGGGTAESLTSAPTAAVTGDTGTTPVAPGSQTVRAVLFPRTVWSASKGRGGHYLLVDWREADGQTCATGYDVQFDGNRQSDRPPSWLGQGDPITDERGAGQRNWPPLYTFRHHGIWNSGIAEEQVRVVCNDGDGRIVGETVAHRGTALPPWEESGEQQVELPAVRLSAGSEIAAEGDSLEFTLTRTGAAEAELAVNLDVSESGAMLAAFPASVPIAAGEASVTFTVATQDDETEEADSVVTVAIAGDGERYALGEPSTAAVTVEDDDGEAAALTAAFEAAPEAHDGTSRFTFELHLSAEPAPGFSYRTLRDRSFSVTGGQVRIARRLEKPSNMHWEITVEPSTDGDVSVTLPADRACDADGAICTAGGGRLSNAPALTVPGPASAPVQEPGPDEAPEPLTAAFGSVPAEHDGETRFTFELRFSEEVDLSYRTLRDHSFSVTGGHVRIARRLARPSNMRWQIAVEPESFADVRVVLPGGRACAAAGAVCTADGRRLSGSAALSVPGPAALSVADARVREGADATLAFAVSLSRAASGPVTVDYATADGTAEAGRTTRPRRARSTSRPARPRRRSRWRCSTTPMTRAKRGSRSGSRTLRARASPTARRRGRSRTATTCRRRGSRASDAR